MPSHQALISLMVLKCDVSTSTVVSGLDILSQFDNCSW